MLAILPLLVVGLCAVVTVARRPEGGGRFDTRDGLLVGALVAGVWAALGAEGLSLFHAFAPVPMAVWWGVPVAVLGAWAWVLRPDPGMLNVRAIRDKPARALIGVCLGLVLVTGLVAWLTPPTTWDCLSYHLPRQMYWIENRSVAHFPAVDLRQLEMPPLAEFFGAELMLLSGNDHQANLVQWFSFVLGALAASAIARDLGAGVRGQAGAAMLTLLNPAAATQAENAKNDLVVALWALVLVWAAARVWLSGRCRWRDALAVGPALGLMLLTKGTGFALALPVCLAVGAGALRARGWRAAPLGAAMVAIAVALNSGHWLRNEAAFGSPLALPADKGGHDLVNTLHSPAALASNIIRNVSIHTSTPLEGVNGWEQRTIERLHRDIGLDASDLRTTSPRNLPFAVNTLWYRDGSNGSPLHLLLAAGLAGSLVLGWRKLGSLPAWPLWVAPFGALLLFCTLLKWQPWHARLHIPFLAIMAPVLGVWLSRRGVMLAACAVLGLAQTVPALMWNESKPLVGPDTIIGLSRDQVLFRTQVSSLESARAAVDGLAVLKPETIAFDLPGYSCEYATMRLTLETLRPRPHFYALHPNYGPRPARRDSPPEATVAWGRGPAAPIRDPVTRSTLLHAVGGGYVRVYVPAARLALVRPTLPMPEFYGWSSEEGLRRAEGPYPQWDLPVVRWAYTPTTTLGFDSDGLPTTLIMEARRNDRDDQNLTVRLNGEVVSSFVFGDVWEFLPIRVSLNPRPGGNVLTLEYANTNDPGPPRSALFRKLQILPDAWIAPPASDQADANPP